MQGNRKTSIRELPRLQIAAELSRFLTTDCTDTIRIKPKAAYLESHPFPIHPPSVVKNDFLHAPIHKNVLHCSFLLEPHFKNRPIQPSPRQPWLNHLQFQHRPPSHSKASVWLFLLRSCSCLGSRSRSAKSTGCSTPRPSPSGSRQ